MIKNIAVLVASSLLVSCTTTNTSNEVYVAPKREFDASFLEGETDKVSIYLQFEEAYMSNDVSLLSPWLSEEYQISQTQYRPGFVVETHPVTKEKLLEGMKKLENPSSMPRSSASDIEIELSNENSFCATSSTVNQTVFVGNDTERKEIRKVCFKKSHESYTATIHHIDYHFRAL